MISPKINTWSYSVLTIIISQILKFSNFNLQFLFLENCVDNQI